MSITRTARKDNTIWYEGYRYSVPLGTYDGTEKRVGVQATETHLSIYDGQTGELLAEHERSRFKGQLIQNRNHRRDRTKGIPAYLKSVAMQFSDPQLATTYLEEIYRRKPRYIRDQLQLIQNTVTESSSVAVNEALNYCLKHKLYQATDFADAVRYFEADQEPRATQPEVTPLGGTSGDKWKVKPHIRDVEVYQRILRGG